MGGAASGASGGAGGGGAGGRRLATDATAGGAARVATAGGAARAVTWCAIQSGSSGQSTPANAKGKSTNVTFLTGESERQAPFDASTGASCSTGGAEAA